jgi:magnesium transporter
MVDVRQIDDLVERHDWPAVQESFRSLSAADAAELLRRIESGGRAVAFRLLSGEQAARVFACLDGPSRDHLLAALTDDETRQIIERMHPDDRTRLLSGLPGVAVQRLMNFLPGDQLEQARHLLGYPPESAGRLMTPEYVAVRESWTAARALAHVRTLGRRIENIDVVLVVDDAWKLKGAFPLGSLVLAEEDAFVSSFTEPLLALYHDDDREAAVDLLLRNDILIAPVVDSDGVLLGVVTADDVFDVAQAEATEDIHLSGAVTPLRVSYREATVVELFRKRMPWLGSLILVNLAASGVIAAYEETLASVLALTFFLPLLLGAAGNAGAQASTLTVRALATGDLRKSEWSRAAVKEAAVGTALGFSMAVLAWLLAIWRADGSVAMAVALSMGAVILISNIVGLTLPFLLTHLKLDPAVASNPLITSVSDVTGVAIYLSVAALVLGG